MEKRTLMDIINEAKISYCAKFIWLMKISLEKQGIENVTPTILASKIKGKSGKNLSRTRVYDAINQIKNEGLFEVYNTPLYEKSVPESGTDEKKVYRKAVHYKKESVPETGTESVPESGTLENGIPYIRNYTYKGGNNTLTTVETSNQGKFPPNDFSFSTPSLDQVQSYFEQLAFTSGASINPGAEAKKFWQHYEAQSWYIGSTPITKWKHKADQWLSNIRTGKFKAEKSGVNSSLSKKDNDLLSMKLGWVEDYPDHLQAEAKKRFPSLKSREVAA